VTAVASRFDRTFRFVHRWVWKDPRRRARKLLTFAVTEADGGRDLARAAELTHDALLRRLYLRHALDEGRHARLFEVRGREILAALPASTGTLELNWLAPGERGLDDLRVEKEGDESLLAFLHLSEKSAAERFAVYRDVLDTDPQTRDVFTRVLRDEAFHMNYTRSQLSRVAPQKQRRHLWWARLQRLWKGYLRFAVALAGLMGGIVMLIQYFVIVPPFALAAKLAQRRERRGFHTPVTRDAERALKSQY
jgi:hypothetical protein